MSINYNKCAKKVYQQKECIDNFCLIEKCDDWKKDSKLQKGVIKCKRICKYVKVCKNQYYRDYNYRKTWGFTEKYETEWCSRPCDNYCGDASVDKSCYSKQSQCSA